MVIRRRCSILLVTLLAVFQLVSCGVSQDAAVATIPTQTPQLIAGDNVTLEDGSDWRVDMFEYMSNPDGPKTRDFSRGYIVVWYFIKNDTKNPVMYSAPDLVDRDQRTYTAMLNPDKDFPPFFDPSEGFGKCREQPISPARAA